MDASQLSESNGTVLLSWVDSSGAGHPLDRVRGDLSFYKVSYSVIKKLCSSMVLSIVFKFDFGSLLSEYTILGLIRHIGDQNETVIGSVGSDWVFGMGNGSSAYWKMGSIVSQSTPADQNWHLFT